MPPAIPPASPLLVLDIGTFPVAHLPPLATSEPAREGAVTPKRGHPASHAAGHPASFPLARPRYRDIPRRPPPAASNVRASEGGGGHPKEGTSSLPCRRPSRQLPPCSSSI